MNRSRSAVSARSTSSSPRTKARAASAVDRDALRWWIIAKTLTWGIGCEIQADYHVSGRVRSIDLAAVGRRAAEQEWDLLELIAPDACRAALAAPRPVALPDDARPYGRPTARELLDAVRELLTDKVTTSSDAALAYEARVAANVLGIVERELAHPPIPTTSKTATAATGRRSRLSVRDKLIVASPRHLDRSSVPVAGAT